MKVVFTAIITINSLFALAQYPVSPNLFDETGLRTGHWTVLYDSTWKEVHHYDSVVYYRLIRFEASKPLGKVRDFYKTGMKQWDGYLLSILPDVMDGESNFYHERAIRRPLHLSYSMARKRGSEVFKILALLTTQLH